MKWKALSRPRQWLVGTSSLVGMASGFVQFVDYAEKALPTPFHQWLPLVTVGGFVCALFVTASVEEKVDAEPSIVINHRSDWDEDEDGHHHYDYLIFRNVGNFPLTKVMMEPFRVLGISLRLGNEIQALVPGEAATEVSLYGLASLLDKVRHKRYGPPPRPTFFIKLTIHCFDWKQRENYALNYAAVVRGNGTVDIQKVHDEEAVEWTDFDALIRPPDETPHY